VTKHGQQKQREKHHPQEDGTEVRRFALNLLPWPERSGSREAEQERIGHSRRCREESQSVRLIVFRLYLLRIFIAQIGIGRGRI